MSGFGDRVPGWISEDQMEFVAKQMHAFGATGKILEIGPACGRLSDYLHEQLPDWKYTAVDPWENHVNPCRLLLDWSGLHEEPNLGEVITKQMFTENCPFVEAHQCLFEDWETTEKFNVINIGFGKSEDFYVIYEKAKQLLQPTSPAGAIVVTNFNYINRSSIESAVAKNNLRIQEIKWEDEGEEFRSSCLITE